MMQRNQCLHEVQSDTCTHCMRIIHVRTIEQLEDVLLVLRINADTIISDADAQLLIWCQRALHVDVASAWSIFDCIRKQVDDYLVETSLVNPRHKALGQEIVVLQIDLTFLRQV